MSHVRAGDFAVFAANTRATVTYPYLTSHPSYALLLLLTAPIPAVMVAATTNHGDSTCYWRVTGIIGLIIIACMALARVLAWYVFRFGRNKLDAQLGGLPISQRRLGWEWWDEKRTIAALPVVTVADSQSAAGEYRRVEGTLDNLVTDGRVERVEPDHRRPGRPPLVFRAVRRMDPGGPRRYRMLAEILTLSLAGDRNAGVKALEAGRAWGRGLGSATEKAPETTKAVDQLADLLDELGFAAERRVAHGEPQVGLRHCPFLELAEHRSDVVCPIHRGIMQGALETWDAPVMVDRLDPFVEPDLCLARLTPEGTAT